MHLSEVLKITMTFALSLPQPRFVGAEGVVMKSEMLIWPLLSLDTSAL